VADTTDLIALELAASRGPVEALERAGAVGGGWVPQRIRAALANSRLHLQPPGEGLRQVAAEIGVPDLGDARRRADDRGATAIEWAIFALLAIAIAGLVAGAITAAVNNRLPGIQ
jgi:Flp pilus assembly pilin Flp